MRLSTDQIQAIRHATDTVFGPGTPVWLFGSRVDDTKKGGDIDLLIQTNLVDINALMRAEITLLTMLQRKLGEQKIDILLDYPTRTSRPPIFSIAKQTGILL